MSGPISIATISGDGAPQHTEFKLTLTLSLRSYEPFPAESIANHMTRVLGNYSDGRHPLDAELIVVSLERIMQTALYQCCVEECVTIWTRNGCFVSGAPA
jgi:hypothetical protein